MLYWNVEDISTKGKGRMKIVKVIILSLLVLSLFGCHKEEQVPEPIQKEQGPIVVEQDREEKEPMTLEEIIKLIEEYYAETNYVTNVYYSEKADQLIVDIYDPDCERTYYVWDEVGPAVPESKQEAWDEYVNEFCAKSVEIRQLLKDNEFKYTESIICLYLDDMNTVEEGKETTLAYIANGYPIVK